MKADYEDYKRVEERGHRQAEAYTKGEEEWERSRGSTNYLPPHVCLRPQVWLLQEPSKTNIITLQLRNEDAFDQRQSKAATGVSRSWQSAAGKRNDHNNNYIGHWPREKRKTHVAAVKWARDESADFEKESQRHTNVRRLASIMISLTDLRSPANSAGGIECSRISTSTFRKTVLDVFKSGRCMLVFDGGIGSQDRDSYIWIRAGFCDGSWGTLWRLGYSH